jgi:hypothetical protein
MRLSGLIEGENQKNDRTKCEHRVADKVDDARAINDRHYDEAIQGVR